MWRILAIARHMIAEGIRMKIALVFIAIIVLLLIGLPFTVAGDGVTLTSRVQSFLGYSLGSVSFLLSLLTVFLSCATLSNEIRGRQIFMVVSKPIPRWQFFIGKWTGILALDSVMLLVAGGSVLLFTYYLRGWATTVPGDREALQSEVLSARYAVRLKLPDFAGRIDELERKLREEGRLAEFNAAGIAEWRANKAREMVRQYRSLGPRQGREYAFFVPLVNREEKGFLHLRIKPVSLAGVDDIIFRLHWQAGDMNDVNTLTDEYDWDIIVERWHTLPIPKFAVNKEGVLYVRMANFDVRNAAYFEGDDSIEVLYDVGTFPWNLFRGLCIIWCRLAFLAALGLLASSFLSFPVACTACLLILLVAVSSGFLMEGIEGAKPTPMGEDPFWVLGPFSRTAGRAFLWTVPDFSKYDPVDTLLSGRIVTLKWVIASFVELVLVKGLLLALAGCVILTKRELAQVVV